MMRDAQASDMTAVNGIVQECGGQIPFRFEDLNQWIFVCEDESRTIVGYICIQCAGDSVDVIELAVSHPYRRQGIGSALLSHVLEILPSRGVNEVFLEVSVENHSAISLYEKAKFQITGLRKAYYKSGPFAGTDAYVLRYIF